MGWHSTRGGANRAPEIFFNHSGSPSWSSKKSTHLTGEEIERILEFASSFAFSEGERDGLRKAQFHRWNPFHPNFLRGEPYRLFNDQLHAGYAAGCQARTERRLDEAEATEREARRVRAERDMQEWGDHVISVLGWAQPRRSRCETLGRTRLERWLLTIIASRVTRRRTASAPMLHRVLRSSYWPCWQFANRIMPRQWRYFPGRVSTTLRRRQVTTYDLRARYYASDAFSKQPRFTDAHHDLSRLEALAMSWYYSERGAYEIEVTGYLRLVHYPHTMADNKLPVERLGWTWSRAGYEEPYLAWPLG